MWIFFVSYSHQPLIPQSEREESVPGTFAPPHYQGVGGGRYNSTIGRMSMGRDKSVSRIDYGRLLERDRDTDKSNAGKQNSSANCSTRLRIWDGGGPDEAHVGLKL